MVEPPGSRHIHPTGHGMPGGGRLKARWLAPLLIGAVAVGPATPVPDAAAAKAVAPVRPAPAVRPVLRLGSRGPTVRQAQSLLSRHGYRVPATGYFGRLTARQVRRFQAAHGIRGTGQVGPLTWPKLLGDGGPPAPGPSPAPAPAGPGGVVYLTFDDGPTPAYTTPILALLARYQARATFFVIGRNAAAHPQLVRPAQ